MSLKIKVTKQYSNREALMEKLRAIAGQGVEVGYFPEQGNHPTAAHQGGGAISYVELAVIHEQGIDVTERPFMEQIWQLNMYRDNKVGLTAQEQLKRYLRLNGKHLPQTVLKRIGEAYMPNVDRVMGNPAYLKVTNNPDPLLDTEELNKHFAYRDTITKRIKEKG